MKALRHFWLLGLFCLAPALAQDGGIESLRQTGKAFSAVAKKVAPAVAFIQVESGETGEAVAEGGWPFQDDLFRHFFGDDFPCFTRQPRRATKPRRAISQGSGFVFARTDETVYVLTNHHVVENAERIRVRFQDGREFAAALGDTQGSVLLRLGENGRSRHLTMRWR